jgi:hypothetical protein
MRARRPGPDSTAGTPRKTTVGTSGTAPGSAAIRPPGFYQVWDDGQEFRIEGALALAIGDELHPLEFEDGQAEVRVGGVRYTVARQEIRQRTTQARAD